MTDLKRVLVTGSRDWPDPLAIRFALEGAWIGIGPYILVHGGARGADAIAAEYQAAKRRPSELHRANWDAYGKRAGYIRNSEMVQAGADICLAFIHNQSRGATMCANLAEKAGIETRRWEL